MSRGKRWHLANLQLVSVVFPDPGACCRDAIGFFLYTISSLLIFLI